MSILFVSHLHFSYMDTAMVALS